MEKNTEIKQGEEKNISDKKSLKNKIVNSNLFRLFIALLVLCACAGLGAGIAVLEDKSDPTEFVAGYFGKFLIQDYNAMYDYIDFDGAYAPKDAFARFMKGLREEHDIGEYEFGTLQKKDDKYLMQISYQDGETGEDKTFDVYLIKHRDSLRQLVADWKITIDEYIVSNYCVVAPKGMELELDGAIVDKSYLSIGQGTGDVVDLGEGETIEIVVSDSDSEQTTESIRINKIIKGTYKARLVNEFNQIGKDIKIVFNKQEEIFDQAEARLRDEYSKQIESIAPTMIQEFYGAARKKKDSTKELLGYFSSDTKVVKSLKKTVKENQKVFYWEEIENAADKYNVVESNFGELQYTASHIGDNKIKANYTFTFDYLMSTETSLQSSYVETYSGTCETNMEITFQIGEDGGLKIVDLLVKNNNKKDIEEEQ